MAHEAVRDIRNTHDDPEAVFVDATPANVRTFLRLKQLLAGLQDELDSSWAVLGEVYGRYEHLDKLGLKLRRVRSNLDDEPRFASSVPYIPCKAAFEADPDLLTLLIGPLYGERPEIGIRELVQNAVDACRELRDYVRKQAKPSVSDRANLDADVVVTLRAGSGSDAGWLEVSDRGIGMTADVVRNYFLKAGASFRRSDAWRRMHESHPGKSRVLRSGRFGIGVLAAFLLGDEVEVSTRHVDAAAGDGIRFKARVDSDEIALLRYERPVGTTVTIKLTDKKTFESLIQRDYYDWQIHELRGIEGWDWYCLSDPSVARKVNSKGLKQSYSLPLPNSDLPEHWHRIPDEEYFDIQWTYEKAPRLTCNGIRVIAGRGPFWMPSYVGQTVEPLWQPHSAVLMCPNMSVFDPNGYLPLLLQRNGLATRKYPFHDKITKDVIYDLIAYLLVYAPQGPITEQASHEAYSLWYEGFEPRVSKWLPYFSLLEGSSFADLWNIEETRSDRALMVPKELATKLEITSSIPIFAFNTTWFGSQDQRAWLRCALGGMPDDRFGAVTHLDRIGARMLVTEETYRESHRPGVISKYYWRIIAEEFRHDGWVLLRSGDCPQSGFDFQKFTELKEKAADGLVEWYLAPRKGLTEPASPLAKAWKELLGSPVIPFSLEKRREKFAAAFDFLKEQIATHEKTKMKPPKSKQESD